MLNNEKRKLHLPKSSTRRVNSPVIKTIIIH